MPRLDESLITDLLSSKLTKDEFIKITPRKNHNEKPNPYRHLWRGVIMQALIDASSNSNQLDNKKIRAKAIAWLNSESDDLKFVSEMAGIEFCYLKKCIRKILQVSPQQKRINKLRKKLEKTKKVKSNRGRKRKPIKESLLSGNVVVSYRNIS